MTKKTTKKAPGRPKGSRNQTPRNRRLAAEVAGMTPLQYLLSIMTDKTQEQGVRVDAAKAAAPYCHARLQSIQVQEKPYDGDSASISNDQLASIIQGAGGSDAPATAKGRRTTH